jgi:DNA-binding MarR family transcriptional regulator
MTARRSAAATRERASAGTPGATGTPDATGAPGRVTGASEGAGPTSDDDIAGRLYVVLARLTRTLRRQEPAQLGHGAVAALATIVRDGPLRVGDLAVREGVRAPTMTRIVASLAGDGYVTREPDPADARASLIRATSDGEELVSGTRAARSRLLGRRIAALSPEHRAALAAALPVLEELVDEEPSRG